MQRYSRKRQAILECVRGTTVHPSAEWVYARLKPVYPDLSLATVYRNLSQLKDAGDIVSMGTVLGQERFDGSVHPHAHAVCEKCSRILDIGEVPSSQEAVRLIEEATGFQVKGASLQFYGVCAECSGKDEANG